MFVIGLVVFTVSSAVCGLSASPLVLNLARAVQGTGGAMMFATSLALIAQAPSTERSAASPSASSAASSAPRSRSAPSSAA